MKIGILAAGHAPRALQPEFGDFASMFEGLLAGRGYQWRVFDTPHGDYPDQPEDYDGYIVTGAPAGVYDGDPWIAELLAFLRAARGRARLAGFCFGHQAMAQAFGGKVIKSPKGWGVGLHTYDIAQRPAWMDASAAFSLSAAHQDQVVELPPGATVLAGSAFCPNGLISYDGASAISCQLHPEFAPAFSAALIERLPVPADEATAAARSLERADDHEVFAGWIARFLAG